MCKKYIDKHLLNETIVNNLKRMRTMKGDIYVSSNRRRTWILHSW